MNPLASLFDTLTLGPASRHGNLTMFPLCDGEPGPRDYRTLDEALAARSARVTEVSEGGSVPNLRFENGGDRPVLLLDGEELVGAKQNRILNLTILVPAHATIKIPVTCVEAGRWSYQSREFAAAPRAQYAEGRARKAAQVSASLSVRRSHAADQRDIWAGIAEKANRLAAHTPTGAMSGIFERHARSVEDYVAGIEPAQGQCGAVFAIGSGLAGLDLFDHPETLRLLLPKLVRSYALDAIDPAVAGDESEAAPTTGQVAVFLQQLGESEVRPFPAVGAGQDLRLVGEGVAGGGLVLEGRVVHFCAFPAPPSGPGQETGRMMRTSARRERWVRA